MDNDIALLRDNAPESIVVSSEVYDMSLFQSRVVDLYLGKKVSDIPVVASERPGLYFLQVV